MPSLTREAVDRVWNCWNRYSGLVRISQNHLGTQPKSKNESDLRFAFGPKQVSWSCSATFYYHYFIYTNSIPITLTPWSYKTYLRDTVWNWMEMPWHLLYLTKHWILPTHLKYTTLSWWGHLWKLLAINIRFNQTLKYNNKYFQFCPPVIFNLT